MKGTACAQGRGTKHSDGEVSNMEWSGVRYESVVNGD